MVSGHTETIAKKADQTALDTVSAKTSANETAIATLNQTTLPALKNELQGKIDNKANSADVYTKTQIGTIAENKTLIDMINEAKSEATYDDTSIKALIQANTDALTVLNGDIHTEGSVKRIASEAAKVEVATLVGEAPEALDTIHEIAAWIQDDETGAAALAKTVTEHSEAIAAINNKTTGILAVAKKYTDDSIAGIPAATAEALGLVKVDNATIKVDNGMISVKEVSTDLLAQGTEELILNGGNASTANSTN